MKGRGWLNVLKKRNSERVHSTQKRGTSGPGELETELGTGWHVEQSPLLTAGDFAGEEEALCQRKAGCTVLRLAGTTVGLHTWARLYTMQPQQWSVTTAAGRVDF